MTEIVGSEDDFEHGRKEIRGEVQASLGRIADLIGRGSKVRRAKPRRS